MAFAKISQVAHYAPAQVVTNDDLSKIMDTSDGGFAHAQVFRNVASH